MEKALRMSCKTTHRNGAATLYVTPLCDYVVYVTAVLDECPDARQAALDAYGKITELLGERRMEIVHERAFGSLGAHAPVLSGRADALRGAGLSAETPMTYLQGHPLWGRGLAGVSLMAVGPGAAEACKVWTVEDDAGRPRGRAWRCCGADGSTWPSLSLGAVPGQTSCSAAGSQTPGDRRAASGWA